MTRLSVWLTSAVIWLLGDMVSMTSKSYQVNRVTCPDY